MPKDLQKQKTRARVVDLLRRGRATVDDLARALNLTDNAVRMHLARLEAEGLVRQQGVRRSGVVGKPATYYEISPESEPTFSRAYAPVLSELVDALGDHLTADEFETVMRKVGRKLAATQPASTGAMLKRVKAASALLNQLGGLTTVEPANGGSLQLRGISCPLASAVSRRPEVCRAVEELLAALVGSEVIQRCQHQPRPACCFEFSAAE
jgi:predicted ArsR family transcriptional regulator